MKSLHKMKVPPRMPTKGASTTAMTPPLSELKRRINVSALGLYGPESRMSQNDSNNSIYGMFSYFNRPKRKSMEDILTRWEPLDAPYQRPHTDNLDQSCHNHDTKTWFRRCDLVDAHPDVYHCVNSSVVGDDSTVDFSDVDIGSDSSTTDGLVTETITYSTHPNDPPLQSSHGG